MAGIYIHIPFCKKACHYCDFNFSTSFHSMERWIDALLLEIEKQKSKLSKHIIHTLYFGGGTPSLLPTIYWDQMIRKIYDTYTINLQEFTIESNPEDLSTSNLSFWKSLGCNRLSIGVQSFQEKVLQWMNRGHNVKMALSGIERARKIGFDNINIDLIYNLPFEGIYKKDLNIFLDLDLPHYSAYTLTIEPKTVFGHRLKKGQLNLLKEKKAIHQMKDIHQKMTQKGYEHYEISNFALPNFTALHNSSYWDHIPYLGLGSGAHSFIGNARWQNIKNNWLYIKAMNERNDPIDVFEKLSPIDLINEKMMFGLRTIKGLALQIIENSTTLDTKKKNTFYDRLSLWAKTEHLYTKNGHVFLTLKGKLIADTIIEDLFFLST